LVEGKSGRTIRRDQKLGTVGILPHILFLAANGAAVVWMKINTRLPFWAALLIVSPQTAAVIYALLTMKDEDNAPEAKHRRYEIASGLICGILLLMTGIRAASYFFLVYLYGLARVRHDHLRFTAMPKGSPWIVSNGDRVSNGHFLHYLIGLGIWMALFLMIYPVIFRLLPERQGES
jgi:cobalamin synthase